MEKTIEQWFQELPEPYRTQTLENCEKQSTIDWNAADATCDKLSDAVALGFLWQDTPEGEEYWQEVYDTIAANEFDEEHDEEQRWEAQQEDNHNLTEFED